jgi:hypothetical protein
MSKAEGELCREARRFEKRIEKHLVDTVKFTTRYLKDNRDYDSANKARHAAFRIVSSMAAHGKAPMKFREIPFPRLPLATEPKGPMALRNSK